MAVTLRDIVRDVLDQLYSYVQVKDKRIYMSGDITDVATTFTVPDAATARSIQPGQVLQFQDANLESELVRVRSVDLTTRIVAVTRGVLGTTARAWTAAGAEISLEPEFPVKNITREINNVITGLSSDLFAIKTLTTTVNAVTVGYALPSDAVGVQSIQYLPSGPEAAWGLVRRYRFDRTNRQVDIFVPMEPGRSLKIVYRTYPTEMTALTTTLADIGLPDTSKQLITWGALYQILLGRASGRLVDTRAETPLDQQYRKADPVLTAVRQVYALYQARLVSERERQRHEWPVRPYFTF